MCRWRLSRVARMSRKFSVGDRVRVVNGVTSHGPSLIGLETIVVSNLVCIEGNWVHRLNEKGHVYAHPSTLEPIYDGTEKASWSDCVWQPKQVRA